MRIASYSLLVTAVLALTACGDSEKPAPTKRAPTNSTSTAAPTVERMLTDAFTTSRPGSDRGVVSLDVSLTGNSDDPQIGSFLNKGLSFGLKGYSSLTATDITGTAKAFGDDYRFEYRGDEARSFVRFDDVWYGPGPGMDSDAAAAKTSITQAGQAIDLYADRVLTGRVVAGDPVEGQPTWRFEGQPNVDGILAVVREEAAKPNSDVSVPSAEDERAIRTVARGVKIEIVVGQRDRLLRKLRVESSITVEDARVLDTDGALKGKSLSAKAVLDARVSDYGAERPKLEVPSPLKPFSELQTAVGAELIAPLMKAGAAGSSPTAPPSSSVPEQTPPAPEVGPEIEPEKSEPLTDVPTIR